MINEKCVKKFCCEDLSLIENYHLALADKNTTWHCHHRLEIELNKKQKELIDIGLYYNRPASELVFLTPKDHYQIHYKGTTKSEETRLKMSISGKGKHNHKGENNPFYGNHRFKGSGNPFYGKHHSEETLAKLRKPKPKFKWLTPNGEIKEMNKGAAKRFHPDWVLLSQM